MEQEKRLSVVMLGGFSIQYANRPVSFGKRTQSRFIQLFQMLMLHREGVAKDDLIEALYGWEEIGNKNNCLNNLVYRLRKQLAAVGLPEEEYVKVSGGLCVWNGTVPLDTDVYEFEQHCRAAQKSADEDEKLRHLLAAWKLYRGDLLPQLASENWVGEESARLKKLYGACVHALEPLLKKRREYRQLYQIYVTASELYPFEEWQEGVVDSLMLLERHDEAYQYYQNTVRLYMEELGMPPSNQMMERFRTMREKVVKGDDSCQQIQEFLREDGQAEGAYYCSYPGFVDAYRAICRGTERSGQSAFLMICSLFQIQGGYEKRNSQNVAKWLRESICSSLRRGDLCTRYSRNKYLILLLGMREQDSSLIIRRIKSKFTENRGTEGYYLEFSLSGAGDSLPLLK